MMDTVLFPNSLNPLPFRTTPGLKKKATLQLTTHKSLPAVPHHRSPPAASPTIHQLSISNPISFLPPYSPSPLLSLSLSLSPFPINKPTLSLYSIASSHENKQGKKKTRYIAAMDYELKAYYTPPHRHPRVPHHGADGNYAQEAKVAVELLRVAGGIEGRDWRG